MREANNLEIKPLVQSNGKKGEEERQPRNTLAVN
jgi:hypothetical protein